MEDISYVSFIKRQAELSINELNKNGFIAGGLNGPYDDNETPIRISAHWIYIFSWLYNKFSEEKYIKSIKVLADYIYSQNIKIGDNKFLFCSREKDGKDHVNGTIGPAWAIEGLIEAAKVLKDEKYYNLAVKVFLSHPFNEKIGCWNRYEIDGRILGYDETFNHQLWLAAAGAQIIEYKDNEEIRKQIECFLDKTLENKLFRIHKDGVIRHFACISDNIKHTIGFFKNHYIKDYLKKSNLKYKEEGYHYFALYGFALLKNVFPQHRVFKSEKMKKAINYALDEKNYMRQLNRKPEEDGTGLAKKINCDINIYCFPYNSPAFELPYIIKQFKPELYNSKKIDDLWEIQEKTTMDEEKNLFKNVHDSKTLVARSYELLKAI